MDVLLLLLMSEFYQPWLNQDENNAPPDFEYNFDALSTSARRRANNLLDKTPRETRQKSRIRRQTQTDPLEMRGDAKIADLEHDVTT